jgi:peroxiredoxin
MKRLIIGSVFLALVASCVAPAGQDESGPAPDFELNDLSGNTLTLSQFKDKVLVLNFWATWCPPCQAEIPGLIATYNKYKGEGLAIIGISLDRLSPEDLTSFVEENRISYPVAFATEQVLDDYKPGRYIPATIVIDKKGRIRSRNTGLMDQETLENLFLRFNAE